MESRLKALKVVELKDVLSKAGVPIPAKANKPDLIAKIIESTDTLSVFEEHYGSGGARQSGASTPKPAAPAIVQTHKGGVEKQTVVTETKKDSDILAPPEPFDWSAGTEPPVGAATKPASKSTTNASAKPPSVKRTAPAAAATSSAADQKSSEAEISKPPVDKDEETKRRRARAERFGLPFVEKPSVQQTQKEQSAATKPVATNAAKNGSSGTKNATKNTLVDTQDPEKLKARAMRFGLADKPNPSKSLTADAAPTNGKKRSAPAETVDSEEAERRRKRAERFGLPVKA